MPSIAKVVTAASTLAALALAGPVPPPTKRGFTVNQHVAKPYQAPVVQLRNALQKYNVAVPEDVSKAAASGEGSVVARPEPGDLEYLSQVTVGGQTLNLDFDTGSSDLWVFSSEQPSSQQAGHTVYNPAKSSTAKKVSGATWKITYGDQSSASGDVYKDTVNVGGIQVTGQAVELAKTVSAQFLRDQNNDGLLGLAFSSINTVQPQQQKTFFDNAIAQNALSQDVFTADLKKGAPGSYDFGFVDGSKHTGSITYTSVDNSNGFWEFTVSGYGVGSSFRSQSFRAIADTGTTLLLTTDSIVEAYYAQVASASYESSQGGYTFDCSATLPDFVVAIGGKKATVPGKLVNLGAVDSSGRTCFGGIQSGGNLSLSILGDVFLKAVFAVFDNEGPRFGWAPKPV